MRRLGICGIAPLFALWVFIDVTSQPASGQSNPPKGSAEAANSWILTPTPTGVRDLGVTAAVRTTRDHFWDDGIGADEPLTKRLVGVGISDDGPTDISEIARLHNRAILTATFASYRSILSISARSVYTEVTFRVHEVFLLQNNGPQSGKEITVCIPGGTVVVPPNQKLSYITAPRTPFIQPGRKYLLVLSYKASGDFYLLGDNWDITDGKVRPNSRRTEMISRKGLSTLNGLSADDLAPAISRILAAENR